ncbi:MAG TPA: TIGR00730 family Rossman fold protein [Saprospiraceae bacterium]|nr:TIGR00730 family Rossman fold protein [Saprospiraceae bacterium]
MNIIRSICVYCGSSTGVNPVYMQDAIALMQIFLENNIRLVNGGGNIGLMGVMADAMLRGKGEAVGVIPLGLKEKEVAHTGMTELHVVPDMHSRKLMMVNLSDAFIAFPGGFGTMDEVFETLTWSQLHLHQKPIVLYNPHHFYDHLLQQADHMLKEGFLNKTSRSLLLSTDNLVQLLPLLTNFKSFVADKWTPSIEEHT